MPRKRPTSCSAAEASGVTARFASAWAARPPGPAALAVSGGSDSVALLRLAAAAGERPAVVTVDHGLRPESAEEAAWVARLARAHGVEHHVLRWQDRPTGGNLQAAAREARYRLIGDWASARGITTVATGHTLDDQAETVLMRLARGSGLDGLAAMRPVVRRDGVNIFRPLLDLGRDALREHLRMVGQDWLEDPGNSDPRFDRIKAREALRHLAPLGLTAERLARTAAHMARAADALEVVLDEWAERHGVLRATGEARMPLQAFADLPEELRLRLLARVLGAVAGRGYRPRFDSLAPLASRLAAREMTRRSLHGCLVRCDAEAIEVFREPGAVAPPVPAGADGTIWDGRWRVTSGQPSAAGLTVAALGDRGLAALDPAATAPEWQSVPRLARLTTPAVWHAGRLIAAPLAGRAAGAGWTAERLPRTW